MPGTVLRMYYLQLILTTQRWVLMRKERILYPKFMTELRFGQGQSDSSSGTWAAVFKFWEWEKDAEAGYRLSMFTIFHCWSSTCWTDYRKLKILARKSMKKRGAGLNSPSSILLLTLEPECQQSFLFFPWDFLSKWKVLFWPNEFLSKGQYTFCQWPNSEYCELCKP